MKKRRGLRPGEEISTLITREMCRLGSRVGEEYSTKIIVKPDSSLEFIKIEVRGDANEESITLTGREAYFLYSTLVKLNYMDVFDHLEDDDDD